VVRPALIFALAAILLGGAHHLMGQFQARDTQGLFAPLARQAWWKLASKERTGWGSLTASGAPGAILEGIKSSCNKIGSHSIVAILRKDATVFESFMDAFMKAQRSSDISASVAVLHGVRFQAFRIGSEVYHGDVPPWWTRLTLWFMQVPWLAAVIVVVLALLLAVWIRQWLRGKARARLKMVEQ
jgi:hypothetical protein